MYVLFIKHNSPSTCQQWRTEILPRRYLWAPQQNRTNKETLQTGYSCCLLSQGLGGRLCQPSLHTCRQCSTDTLYSGQHSHFQHPCVRGASNNPDSWKTLQATVYNVLFHGWTHTCAGCSLGPQSCTPQSTTSIQCIIVLSTDTGFTTLTKNTVPENLMGHLSGLKQTLDGQVLLGQDICLSCESSDLYWATLNSFLKGTGKERSENKWG